MKTKITLLIIFSLTALSACDDFVQDRIDDKNVEIIAPVNGSTANSTNIIFAWEDIKEASGYRLQLTSPDFQHASTLLIDSLITWPDSVARRTSITHHVPVGDYEWRVKAVSSGSETPYSYAKFEVVDNNSNTP